MTSAGETDLAVVGSYTEEGGRGLVACRVDRSNRLEPVDAVDEANPSYLTVHPTAPIVVTVNEVAEGVAVTYRIDPETGTLARVDRASTGNAGPCHVAVDPAGEYLVVSHYDGGSVGLHAIDAGGSLSESLDLRHHEGSGPRAERQAEAHPHSAWFLSRDVVYVPDLGADRLVVYELDRSAERLRPLPSGSLDVHPGAGPRHLATHPHAATAYLLNELDSTLTVLDTGDVRTPSVQGRVSTLPDAGAGMEQVAAENLAADVHVDPHGELLVASNRGHDSLAVFDVAETPARPDAVAHVSTQGRWPRNVAFGPDGDAVFVCNQHSDDVVALSVETDAEAPAWNGTRTGVAAPACLRFLDRTRPRADRTSATDRP
jgi:6-phosphogluconolactonase